MILFTCFSARFLCDIIHVSGLICGFISVGIAGLFILIIIGCTGEFIRMKNRLKHRGKTICPKGEVFYELQY